MIIFEFNIQIEQVGKMSINWYMSLYYKYRDYPVTHINNKYKRNELRNIYASIFSKLSLYFYIDIEQFQSPHSGQPIPSINQVKSSTKISDCYSSAICSSLHSRFFQSSKRIATKRLKSQKNDHDEAKPYDLMGKSMASINIFKNQDSAIDDLQQTKMENMGNLLRLLVNTSREVISGILILNQNPQKDSNYEIDEESSVNDRGQKSETRSEGLKKTPKQEIQLQVIPSNNQQINYYFLQFCSVIEVKDPVCLGQDELKLKTQKSMTKLDDRSYGNFEHISLKDIAKKSGLINSTQVNTSFDLILLRIMQKELEVSNHYLSKYQNQTNGTEKKGKKEGLGQVNIIIETWLELITILENEKMLFEIIQELVKGNGNPFSEKVSSYLHFICLVNTKFLLTKTVSKQNFLNFIPDFLAGSRSLDDFKLEKKDGFITIYDVPLDRYMHGAEAFSKTMDRWQHLGRIISELLIHNPNIFWAKIFQSCCALLDKYMEQKIEFSYSMLLLYESIELQQNSCCINVPLQKRQFYQRALKLIIEREIQDAAPEFPSSRSQIKSKSSVGKSGNFKNQKTRPSVFACEEHQFVFYDERTTDKEEKILELRQWEKVIEKSINRLKGYRKILDVGLQIFEGTPQFVAIFFLENYFNFKKIEVLASFNFLDTVNSYCNKVKSCCTMKTWQQNHANHPFIKPILTQLEMHKQNYRQISKHISAMFRSNQMTAKSPSILTPSHFNSGDKEGQHQKNEEQSNYSEFQTNPSKVCIDFLPVLHQGVVISALERLESRKSGQFQLASVEDIMLIGEINRHLKLLNECNFILNLIQSAQLNNNPKAKPILKLTQGPKQMLVLNSHQLSLAINKLCLQQQAQSKNIMMQTQYHRKNSNPNKSLRMSSMNTLSFSKKISVGQNSYATPTEIQVDLVKIRFKIGQHSECLELLILTYCKLVQFYRLLIHNMQCQQCFDFSDDCTGRPRQNIGQGCFQSEIQRQYRGMASKRIIPYIKKYQELNKSSSTTIIQQLQKQLCEEIESSYFNNQTLMIFMFMASLHVDNDTFLAIYKQDLISQQRMEKVKVIGKAYFESVHSLYTRASRKECGKFFVDQTLQDRKDMYLQNLLIIIIAIVQMLYDRSQQCLDLTSYTRLLTNYFISKVSATGNKETIKTSEQLINLSKLISQCFDWNEQGKPDFKEKQLISQLLELRTLYQSQSFSTQLRTLIEEEFIVLDQYEGSQGRVEYLQKKLLYLMLREVYFNSYYDVGIFEIKSSQAKKNFAMYEVKMISFFKQIITKDQEEFIQRKTQELKQRSAHLRGYMVDYEKEPPCKPQEKSFLMKIVCICDKTLNLLTENREFQMKKRGANSISVLRKNKKKSDPIYMHYVSTQYTKPNKERVKVFQNQSFYFFRAIQIYEGMLSKKVEDSEKKYSIYKELGFSVPTQLCVGFVEGDIEVIRNSKDSLLALWINYQYKNLHESKMMLSHQNYLSKIEKLYIDLDVRHKVFESFKDKILNYQMQKTKIYHQYMDYIRGLKLDVYSHVSGEDPLPYFKLINAIKIYRLNIKKKELEEKIEEEFGKNLGKWNDGIVEDMNEYQEWVASEMKVWQKMEEVSGKSKKELFEIYGIVNKELKKQQNKIITEAQATMKTQNATTASSNFKGVNIRKSIHKQKIQFK